LELTFGIGRKEKFVAQLAEHPTVKHFYEERMNRGEAPTDQVLDAAWLRQLCLDAGADDVGFVERDRPEIADQKADIENVFPRTRTLISVALEEVGIGAINGGAVGFPMEADRWGSKMWVISHKPVAVAAGLGQMGIHRNVIHPKFGNFILLGTVLVDAEISEYSHPVVYNPCLECKLCVAACPTGAIGRDGSFDFSACYTHNYREFMGGFNDWVEKIADSKSALDYREKVSGAESVSMWQSLSFGANYKAAYCLSVCPAGEDVIAPFLTDRKEFLKDVVKPLQDKTETIYVVPGSDAEDYVARRFPHKKTKRVSNGLAGQGTIRAFLRGLNFVFQKGQSKGLNAVYHFTFTGHDEVKATVTIRDENLQVSEGHNGQADLRLTADSQTWLRFLRKEANLVWALLRRKIRIQGSPKLLLAFGRCFPS
jgi:ferredoxin